MLNVRQATQDDLPQLRDFERQLIDHERAVEPTLIQEGQLEYYDLPTLIQDGENAHVLIAEMEGKPVGCGLAQIKENDPCYQEAKYGYVGLMFVDPAERGKNIGATVMKELKRWLHKKDLRTIRLKVYASNPGAIRAYEKYGFEPYIQEMKSQLGEDLP